MSHYITINSGKQNTTENDIIFTRQHVLFKLLADRVMPGSAALEDNSSAPSTPTKSTAGRSRGLSNTPTTAGKAIGKFSKHAIKEMSGAIDSARRRGSSFRKFILCWCLSGA